MNLNMPEAACLDASSEKHSICWYFPFSTEVTCPCYTKTKKKKVKRDEREDGLKEQKIVRPVKFNTQVPGLYWLLADRPQSIA